MAENSSVIPQAFKSVGNTCADTLKLSVTDTGDNDVKILFCCSYGGRNETNTSQVSVPRDVSNVHSYVWFGLNATSVLVHRIVHCRIT